MTQEYSNILAPVDGSYEADLAFRKAIAVAKRNDAHLHLVHVIDTRSFQDISSFDSSVVEDIMQDAKKLLDKYVHDAKADGFTNIDYSIEYGSPKTTIANKIPKDLGTDLIMIGATGLNGVERLLIGSVTEYVTRNAICDVLVVRTNLDNQPVSPKTKMLKIKKHNK